MRMNKDRLSKQLRNVVVYPEIIPELAKIIKKNYETSQIDPGENVGILAAQSIGEKQTQSNLNSFHKAGLSEKSATTGVSRCEELLNATQKPKNKSCFVFFKDFNDSVSELAEAVGSSLVSLTFKRIAKSVEIVLNKAEEPWYPAWKMLYGDIEYKHCISISVDMAILYEYSITLESIASKISKIYSDITCVVSPLGIGKIDLFVDTSDITLPEKRLLYVKSENVAQVYLEEVVQPIIEELPLCGIEGVENLYYMRDPANNDKWIIETDGCNFEQIMMLDNVDIARTYSDNAWDIYRILGIEAARQFLIDEFARIMAGINHSHITIMVERMTFGGTIASISRYTMRGDDAGPMSKASFEETVGNFIKAGAAGEIEQTNGVSASIICGKRINTGTGFCKMIPDMKMIAKYTQKMTDDLDEEDDELGYDF